MKKLSITLFLGLVVICAQAKLVTGSCGTNLTFSYDTETAVLTISGSGKMTNWTYSDNAPWYSVRALIKSINLSPSMTSIGDYAFCGCSSLSSVTIPEGIDSIGHSAFSGCTFTKVTIPSTVTSIGCSAFYSDSLKTIYFNNETPCNICDNSLSGDTIYVPCNTIDIYRNDFRWNKSDTSRIFEQMDYVLTLTTDGGGTARMIRNSCANTATIEATPDQYSQFSQWSDGNSDNPRTISLTKDETIEALFSHDPGLSRITIQSDGTYASSISYKDMWDITQTKNFNGNIVCYMDKGTEVTINFATAFDYWTSIVEWSDGEKGHTRTFTAASDVKLSASLRKPKDFIVILYGQSLTGNYSGHTAGPCSSSISEDNCVITIHEDLNEITLRDQCSQENWQGWSDGVMVNERTIVVSSDTIIHSNHFRKVQTYDYTSDWKYNNTELTISYNGKLVTAIDSWGGHDCDNKVRHRIPWIYWHDSITSITIKSSVTDIDQYAFAKCTSLKKVTCFTSTPPTLANNAFYGCNVDEISLYVPYNSINDYKNADYWKNFKEILPISADQVEVTTVSATVDETIVSIAWPKVNNAESYTIQISQDYYTFCTLIFNNNGQLMSIDVSRRSSGGHLSAQATMTGWKYTIDGLSSRSTYTYSVVAKDINGYEIDTKTGSFTTDNVSTSLNQLTDSPSDRFTKFIKDCQLYILRDGKTYNAQGGEL